MIVRSISNLSDSDYDFILKETATYLSKIHDFSFKIEYEELRELHVLEVACVFEANILTQNINNLSFEKEQTDEANKELNNYRNYILDINNYINGSEDDKAYILNEWVHIFDACRITSTYQLMNKIKNLRLSKNLTQTQIANLLGISYQAYAHYEKGRRSPSIMMIIKLAKLFNVSLDYLFDISQPKILNSDFQVVDNLSKTSFFNFYQNLKKHDITDKMLENLTADKFQLLVNLIKQFNQK